MMGGKARADRGGSERCDSWLTKLIKYCRVRICFQRFPGGENGCLTRFFEKQARKLVKINPRSRKKMKPSQSGVRNVLKKEECGYRRGIAL